MGIHVNVKGDTGARGLQGEQGTAGAGILWHGAWSDAAIYVQFDGVEYLGSSYISKKNENNENNLPTDTAWWDLWVAKGTTGAKGDTGEKGATGDTGLAGAGITWQGEWNSGTAYSEFDGVQYLGSSYVANTSVGNTNKVPTNVSYWDLWVSKGDTGAEGVKTLAIKTGDYTLTTSDDIIICNKTTAMTITLFVGTGLTRKIRTIKNINTGVVTISLLGDTIDSQASQAISQWESISLVDTAANTWVIV
jgi:hypothetical protein